MVVPVKDIFYTKDIFYKGHFPEFKVLAIHAHPWVAPLFKCHNLPQWQTLLKSTSKKHWNQESQTVARDPYLHLAKVTKLPVFPRKRFHLNNRYVFSKRMWQLSIELYALSFFFLFFYFPAVHLTSFVLYSYQAEPAWSNKDILAKPTFIYFVNQQSALCKSLIVFQSLSNLAALVGKAHLRCELSDIMIWLEIICLFSFNGRGAPAR